MYKSVFTGEIKIESGLPVPEQPRRVRWPWKQMKAGDSFLIPVVDGDHRKVVNRLCAATRYQKKKAGGEYAVRYVGDGVRVWKVA